MVVAAVVGGLIGARFLFVLGDWQSFVRAPLDFVLTGAGFTWYGGLVGGIIGVSWLVRRKGIPWFHAADIAAPALALAYGIGRLGCHFAGNGDWGTVTTAPWGVAYTEAIIGWVDPRTGIPYPAGMRVHPTPVYELLQSIVVLAILWSLRKKNYPSGTVFWLYLILTGAMRFVVEFWRVNTVLALSLTEAQWFGLMTMVTGFLLLYARSKAPLAGVP